MQENVTCEGVLFTAREDAHSASWTREAHFKGNTRSLKEAPDVKLRSRGHAEGRVWNAPRSSLLQSGHEGRPTLADKEWRCPY